MVYPHTDLALVLEATERKTQLYLATCNCGRFEATEYRPLICMEEGNQLGVLAISGGHGSAQAEYVMRRSINWAQWHSQKFS